MSEHIRPIYSIESCQAETRKTGKHNSITTKHGLQRLISGSAIPSLSISVENSVEDDDNAMCHHHFVPCSCRNISHTIPQNLSVACSEEKGIISLHEDVLGLLQPLHLVLDFQIDLRLTKMVPHNSPCQKRCGLTPKLSH